MTTAIAQKSEVAQFKVDIDSLLEKRKYFIERILPTLIAGQDYYIINGKKSLGKAGAEKLAAIYNLVATFERDEATMKSFADIPNLIAYVATLFRPDSSIAGQGRGSAVVTDNNGDVNKTIKMAQKSAFVDSVIRSTGLSGTFTQDRDVELPPVEDNIDTSSVDESDDWSGVKDQNNSSVRIQQTDDRANMVTSKQKKFLETLSYEDISDTDERERFLATIDSMSREDASEMISSMIQAREQR